ncbi:amino acid ABC transporter substrate-binding protein [Gordonia sp. TBRC 11910]|uniref:Amino acid ABC transporter substrate-binding protein n=1 Tax=Gordonia asplenii TaxID=2725283 RepID=A0A848KVI9_9ACTN|nr:ABC transporter substrate-binding protein [Gordonia asplenii]NMO00885.1 amino acid ABC transporter substrate-binding protein [Gordonia asplenii]
MSETIRLACVDAYAPPLFSLADSHGKRQGYEPAAAELVATEIGATVEWVVMPFGEMIPAVRAGRADAVWCGQAITPERARLIAFTRPYAVFDESALVARGSGITSIDDLRGRRVAAIAGSANLALVRTFADANPIPFDAGAADVFGDMIDALRRHEVDAVVDDDVAFASFADDPHLEIGFTVRTRNRWAAAVSKDRPELLTRIDDALGRVIADGRLEKVWNESIAFLEFPGLA